MISNSIAHNVSSRRAAARGPERGPDPGAARCCQELLFRGRSSSLEFEVVALKGSTA